MSYIHEQSHLQLTSGGKPLSTLGKLVISDIYFSVVRGDIQCKMPLQTYKNSIASEPASAVNTCILFRD